MSDVDVGKIVRDLEIMKENMTKLAKCQSDMQDIIIKRDEKKREENRDKANTVQPDASGTATQDGAASDPDIPTSDTEYDTRSEVTCTWSSSGSDHAEFPPLPLNYASAAAGKAADPTLAHDWSTKYSRQRKRPQDSSARRDRPGYQHRSGTDLPSSNKQSHGMPVVIGTGVSAGQLNAVPQRSASHEHSRVNKTVTGVFATRFLPRTTSKQIEQHIKQNTGLDIWVQKLITKYEDYCSFYLRARDRKTQSLLMSADLWAKGILLKPYME